MLNVFFWVSSSVNKIVNIKSNVDIFRTTANDIFKCCHRKTTSTSDRASSYECYASKIMSLCQLEPKLLISY